MAPEYFAVFYFMVTMCFSPGPNNILCTAHAAKYGHKKTIPLILGIAIGFTTIGIIIAFLSDWLSSHRFIFNIFVYLGAAYIFYLAWKVGFSSFINNAIGSLRSTPNFLIMMKIMKRKNWALKQDSYSN